MAVQKVLSEQEQLSALARELGWSVAKDRIVGKHRNKSISIAIDRTLLHGDLLVIALEAPSVLVASICRESFRTHATERLAAVMEKFGAPVYADFETGDPETDSRLFFSVNESHKAFLQALIERDETLPLLKKILSRFEWVNMTGSEIEFSKHFEKNDLDSAAAHEALEWIEELDALDGIYL